MTEAPVQTAPGVPVTFPEAGTPEAPQFANYFAFSDTKRWFFPDGTQWIQFHIMNEGDKAKFQRKTNRDIKINQKTQDATVKMDPAEERWELIKSSADDWYVFAPDANGRMQQVPFTVSDTRNPTGMCLERWLALANPKLVEELEFEIRKANPWLQADMSVEEIDKEISRLQELRIEAEKRDSGN
jgi:hypothetical protein